MSSTPEVNTARKKFDWRYGTRLLKKKKDWEGLQAFCQCPKHFKSQNDRTGRRTQHRHQVESDLFSKSGEILVP